MSKTSLRDKIKGYPQGKPLLTFNATYKGNLVNGCKSVQRQSKGKLKGKRGDVLIEKKLAELIAFLKVDYMLSDETELIENPKRNDDKYAKLCKTWEDCYILSQEYEGKIPEGSDPDFPMSTHFVKLVLPTENDEIILREIKNRLSSAIDNADEVNIDTDINGNIRIYFGFEDVYTRET